MSSYSPMPPALRDDEDHTDPALLAATKGYLKFLKQGAPPSPQAAEAWDRFFRIYTPLIRRFVASRRLAEPDRSDCVQEIWKDVVAGLDGFEYDPDRGRLRTWLLRLANNKAVDVVRRRARRPVQSLDEATAAALPARPADPADESERREAQGLVHDLLGLLARQTSSTSYRIFCMRWVEGRGVPEIAVVLGLSPETVRTRDHRTRKKFRILFEQRIAGP